MRGKLMNKYNYIALAAILSVAPYGLTYANQAEKPCIDTNRNVLNSTIVEYILAYVALYGAIPAISVGTIALFGDTALKHSFGAFKALNYKMSASLLKTVPITASLALTYNSIKKNISQ